MPIRRGEIIECRLAYLHSTSPFGASIGLMTDNHDLHVEVQGDYIIITLPGTKFMVTYYKAGDPPQLMAKSDWTDDPDAPVTLGAFRARAWLAATYKARELGWIVGGPNWP